MGIEAPNADVIEQRQAHLTIPALAFVIEQSYILVRMPNNPQDRASLLQLESRHLHDAFTSATRLIPREPYVEPVEGQKITKEPPVKKVLDLLFAHGSDGGRVRIDYVGQAQSIFRAANAENVFGSRDSRALASFVLDYQVGKEEELED